MSENPHLFPKRHDVVVLLGREEMSATNAEQQARAIHCDEPNPLNLTGQYRKVPRCHRMRDGSAVAVEVYEHEDRRVQTCTEAKRERGMAQALDRLIAYARKAWRVLPLSPEFLAEQAPHIATSVLTAKRLVAEIKRATSQIELYLSFGPFKPANYWLAGQRRPSTAMFFATAGNGAGIAALERLFGKVTVQVAGDADAAEAEPATKPADQENRVVKIEGADLELLVNTATASSDQKAALADAMSRLRARDSGLPNRWPTSKWAREMADKELAGELGDYMPRLMSPIPEINGYVSLLKDSGPVARISGPCKQLALRVLERMGLSLFTFRREAQ